MGSLNTFGFLPHCQSRHQQPPSPWRLLIPLLKTPFITAGRDPAETAGACCLSTGHLIFSKHLLNPLSGRPGTMGARPRPRAGDPKSSAASGRRCRSLPGHRHWDGLSKRSMLETTSLHLRGKGYLHPGRAENCF